MIVIVAGMHRSGTSALAGMLHNNGIRMGRGDGKDFYPPPMRENPKGFFENVRFRRVNDAALAEHGYRVKSFDPIVPVIKNAGLPVRERMECLIAEYDGIYPNWGWKDPRTCLLMNVWLDILRQQDLAHKVKILVPCRATTDIARSMMARGNKGSVGQFEDLARMYNRRLIAGMADFQFMTIDFDRLIYKTETVAKELTAFLNYPVTDTTFIEPEITAKVA